jgi:CHAT domain-containing protein
VLPHCNERLAATILFLTYTGCRAQEGTELAGGAAGTEALSGLARAFIYSGARALLVSHWSVDSAAGETLHGLCAPPRRCSRSV